MVRGCALGEHGVTKSRVGGSYKLVPATGLMTQVTGGGNTERPAQARHWEASRQACSVPTACEKAEPESASGAAVDAVQDGSAVPLRDNEGWLKPRY